MKKRQRKKNVKKNKNVFVPLIPVKMNPPKEILENRMKQIK